MPLKKPHVVTGDLSIYAVDFAPDGRLVTGGSVYLESSVQNRIDVYDFSGKVNKLSPYTSLSLESLQSNDISLAVHPSSSMLAVGLSVPQSSSTAKDCKILDITETSIVPRLAVRTNSNSNHQYTQIITRFSASGRHLIAGFDDGRLAVLRYPSMAGMFPPLSVGEILDLDVQTHCNEELLAVAASKAIQLINVRTGATIEIIESPTFNQTTAGTFAACRFGRMRHQGYLYTVVNVSSKNKTGAFICLWRLGKRIHSSIRQDKTASVTRSPITAFNMSADGSLLAFATKDLSVGLIDASTLQLTHLVSHTEFQPIYRVRNAHTSPIFTISLSVDNTYIASAAGKQLRVAPLPKSISTGFDYSSPIYVFLSMLMFALFAHMLVLKY